MPKLKSLVAFIVILSLFALFAKSYSEYQKKEERLEAVKKEVRGLSELRDGLAKELDWVKSDAFVEKEAREKLGLVAPGEKFAILPDKQEEVKAEEPAPAPNITPKTPNYLLWHYVFFGSLSEP